MLTDESSIEEAPLQFSSLVDELSHWKRIAEESLNQLQLVREEFEEYQRESGELERELETQLRENERSLADLQRSNVKLKRDSDMYKEKSVERDQEACTTNSRLEQETGDAKKENEELKKYIRELEQTNDDLERGKRVVITTLEEFDLRLNNLIERNAFLESELEERDSSIFKGFELKDGASSTQSTPIKKEFVKSAKSDVFKDAECEKEFKDDDLSSVHSSSASDEGIQDHLQNYMSDNSDIIEKESSNDESEIKEALNEKLGNHNEPPLTKGKGFFPFELPPVTTVNENQRIIALDILSELLGKVGMLESKFSKKGITRENHFMKSSPLIRRSLAYQNKSLTSLSHCLSNTSIPRLIDINI